MNITKAKTIKYAIEMCVRNPNFNAVIILKEKDLGDIPYPNNAIRLEDMSLKYIYKNGSSLLFCQHTHKFEGYRINLLIIDVWSKEKGLEEVFIPMLKDYSSDKPFEIAFLDKENDLFDVKSPLSYKYIKEIGDYLDEKFFRNRVNAFACPLSKSDGYLRMLMTAYLELLISESDSSIHK